MSVRFTVVAVMIAAATPFAGQKTSPADVAAKMSGTWTINRTLSPAFGSGRSGPGRGRGAPAYAFAGAPFQRGGRGGGGDAGQASGSDLTPQELAEHTAIRELEQIPPKLTITATAESFSITGAGVTETCAANGKGDKLQVGDASVALKCRWEKDKLRQEFSTTRSKLIRVWGTDEADHLVLKGKLEGIGQNTPEATFVFDRGDR